jgi:N-methylhydantoinase A
VGADTGGTFTDIVAVDAKGSIVYSTKVSTTPDDPSRAVLEALEEIPVASVEAFLHGTTTATNALLERRGARTALLTTQGFRDVLELGRQNRPALYDWFRRKPPPLVPRELRFEIDERMSPHASARRALNEEQARAVIRRLRDADVESVAVSLLHSYDDDRHERHLGRLLAEQVPNAVVSLSTDVAPEIMEYERTSTTVVNAYLAPVMTRYLNRLVAGLRKSELRSPVYVMQSDGGLGAAQTIAQRSVQTVLSGPAAGVIGGLASTSASGKADFLTIDMGGTSFDIAYAEQRKPAVSRSGVVDGLPVAIPTLDIHTLGAGGGSIAWVDSGGALRVGPLSAGSSPGPACYGRGGEQPTVTDANVVLGRLGGSLLGGRLPLDVDAAWRAIEDGIGRSLGLTAVEAAQGVIQVVNASMAKGMHLMSTARGRDPRSLGVVAFGGAGPLHACELARRLGSSEVIIPPLPGNTSAVGLALADVRRERTRVVLAPLFIAAGSTAKAILADLAAGVVADLENDGADPTKVTLSAIARLSYEGQRYQIDLPIPIERAWAPGSAFPGSLTPLREAFAERHLHRYGYERREAVYLFSLVVVGTSAVGAHAAPAFRVLGTDCESGTRGVWFEDRFHATRFLSRAEVDTSDRLVGPVVIEQPDSTIVIPPGWEGRGDRSGSLVLRDAG